MTWADDPESNYKKQATANMYEAQSIPDNENSAEQFYANPSNTQQQTQQHDYSTSVDNGPASGANESTHYQYDNSNQYDDGQYQYQQQPDAAGTDDGYYYGTEQMNQYDQYGAQPEVQPQQQEVSNSLSSALYWHTVQFARKYNLHENIWSKSISLCSAFSFSVVFRKSITVSCKHKVNNNKLHSNLFIGILAQLTWLICN